MEVQSVSSKKAARMENKKKKMQAYLEIIRLNDLHRVPKIKADTEVNSMSSVDEPTCKKLKTDIDLNENSEDIEEELQKNIGENLSFLLEHHNTMKGGKKINEAEYAKLRHAPRIKLNDVGLLSSISLPAEERTPIFLSDVQNLLLYALLWNHSPYKTQRWCIVQKPTKISNTCFIIVENMSLRHYNLYEKYLPKLQQTFEMKVEVITPSVYNGALIDEVATVPLTSTQKQKLVREYGSLQEALNCSKVFSMLKAVFPVKERVRDHVEMKLDLPEKDKFPRTHLLLSACQLVEEDYPLPLKGSLRNKYLNYVMTKDVYMEVSPTSPMYAIDCEMCRTTTGQLELTRISVVNERHECCYESLVKPHNKIVDYLTKYSGITSKMLKNVKTRLPDVQRALRELLPADAILVGQSLNSDLHSLQMMHPYIIDTSIIFNLTGERLRKTKLQVLAQQFLDVKIQQGNGHCSLEDSLSSLKLVQLKLTRSIEFGDAVLAKENKVPPQYLGSSYYGYSFLHHVSKYGKRVSIYADQESVNGYKKYIQLNEESSQRIKCVATKTDKEAVNIARGKMGGPDLSIVHLRLKEQDLESTNAESVCTKINKYIDKLWTSLPTSSLCVVLFGGESGGTGAALIQIKTDIPVIESV